MVEFLIDNIFVNPIQAGGGTLCPPTGFCLVVPKRFRSRLMKVSDFSYNYIGHHLKQFLVDSNLGCCHGRGSAFVKERLGKISSFS